MTNTELNYIMAEFKPIADSIKEFSKKVIKLFTVTGIVFSLGGLFIVIEKLVFGLIILFVALLVFVVKFASIYKNS